jgi:hypothetical protein
VVFVEQVDILTDKLATEASVVMVISVTKVMSALFDIQAVEVVLGYTEVHLCGPFSERANFSHAEEFAKDSESVQGIQKDSWVEAYRKKEFDSGNWTECYATENQALYHEKKRISDAKYPKGCFPHPCRREPRLDILLDPFRASKRPDDHFKRLHLGTCQVSWHLQELIDKLRSDAAYHQDSTYGIDGSFRCQNGQSTVDIVDETPESSVTKLSTDQM